MEFGFGLGTTLAYDALHENDKFQAEVEEIEAKIPGKQEHSRAGWWNKLGRLLVLKFSPSSKHLADQVELSNISK